MKHLIIIALAFPLLAFGQVGSINVPLILDTNAVPISHPGFFATNAAAIASAAAPVISLDAGRITSGVLPISRIATGTPTGTKFVRDDGTLATPAGGGGGSNFITSVSADFQVLLEALSLTNATGTGQLLRASTLSPYLLSATASTLYQPLDPDLSDLADGSLTGSKVGPGVDAGNITIGTLGDARIPATIARLDSPQFTGTVGFEFLQADTVQVPWASRYATANGSSNLVGTLDGGSWTNLNGTEIRSGTIAAARIDSAIARTDSPNFTGNPTVPTASPGDNDTSAASTAFVTAAVAAGGGGSSTNWLIIPISTVIAISPADSTTYFVGPTNFRTIYTNSTIRLPVSGTVRKYWVRVASTGTLGSGESVNYYLRINDTTDFGNFTDTWDSAYVEDTSGALGQAVSVGDQIALKVVSPAWATNPTNVYVFGWILVEY